ncbi:MAG TPA: xanthine dehydrogenase family protein subunit M [Rhodoblastus sp.]|nr:xanthine dehydrogenase family protein subunit M [Rhodoblastus sp.]
MLHRPQSTAEALELLRLPDATILAGGTDIFPAHVDRPPPKRLIDISRLADLRGLVRDGARVRIGAATTWTEIARADLPPAFDMLRQAALEIGAVQIQNRGTIGGNLCNASPAADGAPPLLALDARVELASPRGLRILALDEFLLGNRRTARTPDEILTAVLVDDVAGGRSIFAKLGARKHLVISIVMIAVLIAIDDAGAITQARIAVGSASATAQRLRDLERKLVGRSAKASIVDLVTPEDLAVLNPIDDLRATAGYRRDAALELVRRALADLAEAAHG